MRNSLFFISFIMSSPVCVWKRVNVMKWIASKNKNYESFKVGNSPYNDIFPITILINFWQSSRQKALTVEILPSYFLNQVKGVKDT